MMGYILRVTNLKSQIPNFEKNETNSEVEIGCLLRVHKTFTNDEHNQNQPQILSGWCLIVYYLHYISIKLVVAECQQRFVVQKTWRGEGTGFMMDDIEVGFSAGHKYAKVRILADKKVDFLSTIVPNHLKARYALTKCTKFRRKFAQSR